MLTVSQVSEMLNIKPSTIYSWVELGKIPYVKIHGLIRFDPQELSQWLESLKRNQSTKVQILTGRGRGGDYLEDLIAAAKRSAYNPSPRGNQTDKIEPQTEGGNYGAF